MADQKYVFSEEYEFWGTFSFQYEDEKFENIPGHLQYAPNKLMELVLSFSNDVKFKMLGVKKFTNIDIIRANLVDKNQQSIHAILLNNQLIQISKIHPSFLLLYPQRSIHITQLGTNGLDIRKINCEELSIYSADVKYVLCDNNNTNLIREFLWNEKVENIDIISDFKLGLFSSSYWHPYSKIHYVLDGPKDILDRIDTEISHIIGNNSNNILKVRAEQDPLCFVEFNNKIPFCLQGVSDYLHKIWGFLCFLMVATCEKALNFEEIKINLGNSNHRFSFFFLYNQTHYFVEKRFSRYNRFAPFTFPKLKEEFPVIIQNFYKRYDSFEKLLNIMRHNYEKEYFDYTNTAALIDCLAFIAEKRGYGRNTKYQDVINHWANSNQEYIDLLNSFLPVSTDNIGKKISDLRAKVYHFETESNQDLNSYFYPTKIFELIISDYIFEEIGVPETIRDEYKKVYMNEVKNIVDCN